MTKSNNFSADQIALLREYPQVFKNVRANRITFTQAFRLKVWEYSHGSPYTADVRYVLSQEADHDVLELLHHTTVLDSLAKSIRRNGKPRGASNEVFGCSVYIPTEDDNKRLLDQGWYEQSNNGGLRPSQALLAIVVNCPKSSDLHLALEAAGIDTAHMGYQRLRTLILLHQGKQSLSARDELYSQTDLEMLNKNLFVSSATSKQIHFKPDFYRIAAVLADFFSIEDILKVFDLGSISFTGSVLLRIRYKILKAEPVSLGQAKMDRNSIEYLSFLGRYIDALGKMTDARFEQIKDCVSNSSPAQKRNLCLHLQKIPGGEYGMSIKTRAQKCGISTTTYYRALNNPDYGQFSLKKEKQDLQDKEAIESVLAYKSVPKGYRQVTMQLTRLGYPPMNHKKVYRLMKKYKLLSEVRKKSPAKIQLRESLKLRTQPNRLKRKFRLYKPLQVFLTDVSYLDYSDGQRAYLSAIKDPVSGKIITALVSSSQDLELGKQTLDGLVPYGSCMLHSDQGALYLNEEFQNKAASMNVILSMSRRGNCWDNASQESFFGHFKDECNYSDCSSLEELQQQISGYVNYYNFERPQASRNKMTPAEYESYLLSLNDQDWEKWLENQNEQYDRMIQKAKEAAIQRTKTDRQLTEGD